LINTLILITHHYIYIEAAVDSNPPPSIEFKEGVLSFSHECIYYSM